MKKVSIVLNIAATLALLLGGPINTNGLVATALAASPPSQPTDELVNAAATANTHILTIPAAAFRPYEDGYDYANHGRYLYHYHSPGNGTNDGIYLAAVNLPNGAVVTKITTYKKYNQADNHVSEFYFYRTELTTANIGYIAGGVIHGFGTGTFESNFTIYQYATINNNYYTYWLSWKIPVATGSNEMAGCAVVIEYTPPVDKSTVISIPAAAFTPYEDGYDYENHGDYILHKAGVSGPNGWYVAPVLLPDGAFVFWMTFYWYDGETFSIGTKATLQRSEIGVGDYQNMAYAESSSGGFGSSSDMSVENNIIDNSLYTYWVIVDQLPSSINFKSFGVVIAYSPLNLAVNRISIPAAAFSPYEDDYDFENHGRYLKHFHSPGGNLQNGWYLAPVNLPQGATVTQVTYLYNNTRPTGSGGGIHLQRSKLSEGNYENMAGIGIGGPPLGFNSYTDDTIDLAYIDNNQYAFWVIIDLPVSLSGDDDQIWACGVLIEYTFNIFLPILIKDT